MINKTFGLLKSKYGVPVEEIQIEDVRIGVFETVIKLTGGLYGIASTLISVNSYLYRDKREMHPFAPGKITGQYIIDLFKLENETEITKSLKIAVLNALSSKIILNSEYKWIENTDPFDLLDLSGERTITIVGAFKTYIEKVVSGKHRLSILEFDKQAIAEPYQKFFVPSEMAHTVLPNSDIVIITGSTIVNGTLEGLLSFVPEKSKVVLTGPSCSFVPDVLFDNKINILGSTILEKPGEAMQLVGEAGMAFHLFKTCARKICILNEHEISA